ncbi:MAG: aminotransferase class V-fold PLP-dependent enzyme, partial [Thermoplasmata archaeon]
KFGNPSSLHSFGRETHEAIEVARMRVAKALSAKPEEIYFTSGGTEADNLALKGLAFRYLNEKNKTKKRGKKKNGHIITSVIEHPAILNVCKYLETLGIEVTYLPVDKFGLVDLKELENAIREDTFLISIMSANNEIGTIEPIEEIGNIAKKNNIKFHTDAVQAFGKVKLDMSKLNIDLLS